eukprot:14356850-Heterocapsa_arctica.AAC.1
MDQSSDYGSSRDGSRAVPRPRKNSTREQSTRGTWRTSPSSGSAQEEWSGTGSRNRAGAGPSSMPISTPREGGTWAGN